MGSTPVPVPRHLRVEAREGCKALREVRTRPACRRVQAGQLTRETRCSSRCRSPPSCEPTGTAWFAAARFSPLAIC
eukprot:6843643-Prymnesium_polylepis.2